MSLKDTLDTLDPLTDWTHVCDELAEHGHESLVSVAFAASLKGIEHRRAQRLILDHLSAAPSNCRIELGREKRAREAAVRTGVTALDEMLGGLRPGEIIELSGGRGSGKTHLALLTVLNHLRLNEAVSAGWISTDARLLPEWALSVLRAQVLSGDDVKPTTNEAAEALDEGLEPVLHRLKIDSARTVDDLMAKLADMRSDALDNKKLRIVVVDSITSLFQGLSSDSAKGHALMVSAMRHLAALARHPDMPFVLIVVNSAVSALPSAPFASFADTRQKPALGQTFPFLVDLTLWCAKDRLPPATSKRGDRTGSVRTIEVWRSRGPRVRPATASTLSSQAVQQWCAVASDGVAMWHVD